MNNIPEKVKDLNNKTFGKLTIIGYVGLNRYKKAIWKTKCVCGIEKDYLSSDLQSGRIVSCGLCAKRENGKLRRLPMRGTPIYNKWRKIMDRCYNKNCKAYYNYGERGIYVCERWKSFDLFFEDIGIPPKGYSLDRIDNDGPYSPENCKWATSKEQANNTRSNVILEFNGETKTLSQWAEKYNMSSAILGWRIRSGWTTDEALNIPIKKGNYRSSKTTKT